MAKSRRPPFVALADLLRKLQPDSEAALIGNGRVLVDGRVLTNPAARVRADASVRVLPERRLRGDVKLSHALDRFAIELVGRVALDLGASAGGFTTALLEHGARRVYAVDVGVGQLLGRLRADPRVVNLEGHNVARLNRQLVPEAVDVITMDLSYLSVSSAVVQLDPLELHAGTELIALVKPTFELRRASLAATEEDVTHAVELARRAVAEAGWKVVGACDAPPTGQHGAREAFLHAARSAGGP